MPLDVDSYTPLESALCDDEARQSYTMSLGKAREGLTPDAAAFLKIVRNGLRGFDADQRSRILALLVIVE